MLKFSEMGCFCPCCRRKPPEDPKDKQNPPEDRNERGTEDNMSTNSSTDDSHNSVPPFRPDFLGGNGEELPRHLGPIKQLYASTGYNLSIHSDGSIRGTNEPYNKWAVLELSSPATGEVRIRGVEANLYLAMNDRGRLYAKADRSADDNIFLEKYDFDSHYNNYISKKHADKNWYVGIKKSGKPKNASKTEKNQKAVKFLPRPPHPQST